MSNINFIEDFVIDNERNKLLINYVNEELIEFYYGVVRYFCNKNKIAIKYYNDIDNKNLESMNLFQNLQIFTSKLSSSKNIEKALDNNKKSILFVDYKNFKKFKSNNLSVNGYEFQKDIKFFLKNKLNLKNDDLINFCIQFPVHVFSEISKFNVNHNYSTDKTLHLKRESFISIRQSIYEIKKANKNLKNLYENIKDEAKFKKFNFLIY